MTHKQEFELHADEPAILAGEDEGANPVEHLRHHRHRCPCGRARDPYRKPESELEGDLAMAQNKPEQAAMSGFLGLDPDVPKGYTNIRMKFKVKADPEDMKQLESLAEFSPVLNTITNGAKVDVEIEPR